MEGAGGAIVRDEAAAGGDFGFAVAMVLSKTDDYPLTSRMPSSTVIKRSQSIQTTKQQWDNRFLTSWFLFKRNEDMVCQEQRGEENTQDLG